MKVRQVVFKRMHDAQLVESGIGAVAGHGVYKLDSGSIPSGAGLAFDFGYLLTDAPMSIIRKAAKMHDINIPGQTFFRARKNPPVYGHRKLNTSNTANLIGLQVYEICYRHAADGKDYKHIMETDDVMLFGMPDGKLVLESARGLRLWDLLNV